MIKLNPKFFPDYDSKTNESTIANNMLYIIGSSVLVEKTQVPFNSGKYYKHNQSELKRCHCRTGAAPVWATLRGMWFDNVEFELVLRSSIYANLIKAMNTEKIIVENSDGTVYSAYQIYDMLSGVDDTKHGIVGVMDNGTPVTLSALDNNRDVQVEWKIN